MSQAGNKEDDSFVCRLLSTVASLHRQPLYSDLTILTPASQLSAHKFVLDTRSAQWGVSSLAEVQTLDWSHLEVRKTYVEITMTVCVMYVQT